MSRIGKLPVAIPAGVEVKLEEGNVKMCIRDSIKCYSSWC